MRKMIFDFVDTCETCQRNKVARQRPIGLLQPLPVPLHPWKAVTMDFIVKLPTSKGFDSICVVVDRLTKQAHFIPCCETISADQTAELFLQNIFRLHGLPDEIITDRGPQFRAHFWTSLCDLLGIQAKRSTAYHPQTDGQTERVNQTLEQYLRNFINSRQDNWVQLLSFAEFSYNNADHTSIQCSPFFANYNFNPRADFLGGADIANTPQAAHKKDIFENNLKILRATLEKTQSDSKLNADKHRRHVTFTIGDKVWLSKAHLSTKAPTKKLDSKLTGPFTIIEQINPVAFRLQLPPSFRIHPVFHVSLLKPYNENTLEGRYQSRPPPEIVDEIEEFLVEDIISYKILNNELYFLVKWEGYLDDENTWEPASNLTHCDDILNDFLTRHPEAQTKLIETLSL
eukprot:Platyproteum_vivax@DN5822_c0_g1_i1.p1